MTIPFSNDRRRFFGQSTAVIRSGLLSACGGDMSGSLPTFPDGFVWGVATAAAQTESRDGRGQSNWDVFADQPGKIADGSTNARCIEFEKRYPGDLALLGQADIQAFRFSVAWPRVQPDGPGTVSKTGLSTYDRMVGTMLANNLTPYLILFHWDIPVWAGDFRSRDIAYRLPVEAAAVIPTADELASKVGKTERIAAVARGEAAGAAVVPIGIRHNRAACLRIGPEDGIVHALQFGTIQLQVAHPGRCTRFPYDLADLSVEQCRREPGGRDELVRAVAGRRGARRAQAANVDEYRRGILGRRD
ncbi:hypothetical protein DID96_27230 [Burkholderia sp. Bp8963]|nr:hypothetical protein DID96_27230 [Burkholderia sp. Bp8963]